MRATTPGESFLAAVAPILAAAGPLPHARLDTGGLTTAPRKQAVRMLKCEWPACGYTVRTARKWLETAGSEYYVVIGTLTGAVAVGAVTVTLDTELGAGAGVVWALAAIKKLRNQNELVALMCQELIGTIAAVGENRQRRRLNRRGPLRLITGAASP